VIARYEVIVDGTRTIYRGDDRAMASALYSEHVQRRNHTTVTVNGQVLMEAYGSRLRHRAASRVTRSRR